MLWDTRAPLTKSRLSLDRAANHRGRPALHRSRRRPPAQRHRRQCRRTCDERHCPFPGAARCEQPRPQPERHRWCDRSSCYRKRRLVAKGKASRKAETVCPTVNSSLKHGIRTAILYSTFSQSDPGLGAASARRHSQPHVFCRRPHHCASPTKQSTAHPRNPFDLMREMTALFAAAGEGRLVLAGVRLLDDV